VQRKKDEKEKKKTRRDATRHTVETKRIKATKEKEEEKRKVVGRE